MTQKSNVCWFNEDKTILIIRVPEYWTWNEMLGWLSQAKSILDRLNNPVTLLFDFQNSTFMPQDAIYNAHRILRKIHLNTDPIVLTGLSLAHHSVLDTLSHLYPQYTKHIVTYDEDSNWLHTT